MKKLLFIILVSFLLVKCTKNEQINKTENLKFQLNQIAQGEISDLKTDPSNCNNPYDFVGELYQTTLDKIIMDESKTKAFYNNDSDFTELFQEALGHELSLVDYNYVDASKVESLFKEFVYMYLNQDPEFFYSISAKMEDCVYNSTEINDDEKIVILQLASVTKFYLHYSNQCLQTNTKSYEDRVERCFREKMEELFGQDGSWFEKALCIAEWPICLGVKLADCAIDEISEES